MSQDSEDDVWDQILANAGQLSFSWDGDDEDKPLFPKDKEAEKINNELYCSCANRQPVAVPTFNEVYYTCSKRLGGCGKEIKDYKP